MLVRMIYASAALEPTNKPMLQSIMKSARRNNERHDLTGMLVFDHQFFLQVLEGERAAVSRLLTRLMADPRHKDLVLLGLDEIDRRSFADWAMAFVPADKISKKLLLRHGISSQFAPHSFSNAGAFELLGELHAEAKASQS